MVEQNAYNSCSSLGHCQTSGPEILEKKLGIIPQFADGDCLEGELINPVLWVTEPSLAPQGYP